MKTDIINREKIEKLSGELSMRELHIEMINIELDRIVNKDLSDETIVEALKRVSQMVKIFKDWRF